MSIANYTDLKSSVINWLHRNNLTTVVPDFITMGEAWLNRDLRLRQMETIASGSTSGDLTLPADFLELRSITVATGGVKQQLKQITPQEHSSWANSVATPKVFSIIGNAIKFGPMPPANTAYEITYLAKVPALGDSTPTNWLLSMAPDVYLYAALLQATPYMKDDMRIPVWRDAYAQGIAALKLQDEKAKYGRGPLYPRVDTQCP